MSGRKIIAGLKEAVEHSKFEPPAARSRWRDAIGEVRVMAVVDSWVMARRPHCVPFVVYLKDWNSRFCPAEMFAAGPAPLSIRREA